MSLLMAIKGLGRRPRGTALVGTALSLAGTALMGLIILAAVSDVRVAKHRQMNRNRMLQQAPMIHKAKELLAFAAEEFEGFRDEHDGRLPEHDDGMLLSIKHVDPWGEKLMYEVDVDYVGLRSAGPDKEFFTGDDVKRSIEGDAVAEMVPLLPIDEGPAEAEID